MSLQPPVLPNSKENTLATATGPKGFEDTMSLARSLGVDVTAAGSDDLYVNPLSDAAFVVDGEVYRRGLSA